MRGNFIDFLYIQKIFWMSFLLFLYMQFIAVSKYQPYPEFVSGPKRAAPLLLSQLCLQGREQAWVTASSSSSSSSFCGCWFFSFIRPFLWPQYYYSLLPLVPQQKSLLGVITRLSFELRSRHRNWVTAPTLIPHGASTFLVHSRSSIINALMIKAWGSAWVTVFLRLTPYPHIFLSRLWKQKLHKHSAPMGKSSLEFQGLIRYSNLPMILTHWKF